MRNALLERLRGLCLLAPFLSLPIKGRSPPPQFPTCFCSLPTLFDTYNYTCHASTGPSSYDIFTALTKLPFSSSYKYTSPPLLPSFTFLQLFFVYTSIQFFQGSSLFLFIGFFNSAPLFCASCDLDACFGSLFFWIALSIFVISRSEFLNCMVLVGLGCFRVPI